MSDSFFPLAGLVLLALLLAGQVYGIHNYQARRQFLNPGYNVPWRQVTDLIEREGRPGEVAVAWWDRPAERYWRGPVRFVDLVDETLTWQKLPPEVADFPRAGVAVWVIDRDRGSDLAHDLTDRLLTQLRGQDGQETSYRLLPLTPAEQYWRERLGGRPVAPAYLTLHRFAPAPPAGPQG